MVCRIVRSIGCAALTLLLVATTCPTFGASAARAVESLSATELTTLPDTTLVRLKTDRTVTLGVLRSEHKLRLQRFRQAAKRGALQRQTLLKKGSSTPVPTKFKGRLFTLVPMNFSLSHFQSNVQFAADFWAFCKAAAATATACLYLPSGRLPLVPLPGTPSTANFFVDSDPLITDQHLCTSEGGRLGVLGFSGCEYIYPAQYNLIFNPGQPTAQGYPVTNFATCDWPFAYKVDPHGAVSLNLTKVPFGGVVSLPGVVSCVVQVRVY
jgi:hypothetical protein